MENDIYIALCPNLQTKQQLTYIIRQVKSALGDAFITQHPDNLHLSIGSFNCASLPTGFQSLRRQDNFPVKAQSIPLLVPSLQQADTGCVYPDLLYRPNTGEFSLAICFPFKGVTELQDTSHNQNIPPHITIGKLSPNDSHKNLATRNMLKKVCGSIRNRLRR